LSKIRIKKSPTADTRIYDWRKVSKEQLLESSVLHIQDVAKGLMLLADLLMEKAKKHDFTKIEEIEEFYRDFRTGFKRKEWWRLHQQEERHHFTTKKYIPKDINLLDILEQIVDGVMAGLARSGKYRYEPIDDKLLKKAYKNTVKLLINAVKVEVKENHTRR